jgi:hypothetical protein
VETTWEDTIKTSTSGRPDGASKELTRSLSRNSSWELGYGERRCGFNTKHQSTEEPKGPKGPIPCSSFDQLGHLILLWAFSQLGSWCVCERERPSFNSKYPT